MMRRGALGALRSSAWAADTAAPWLPAWYCAGDVGGDAWQAPFAPWPAGFAWSASAFSDLPPFAMTVMWTAHVDVGSW